MNAEAHHSQYGSFYSTYHAAMILVPSRRKLAAELHAKLCA